MLAIVSLTTALLSWAALAAGEARAQEFAASDLHGLGTTAVVCRDARGKLQSVRTLDLAEGGGSAPAPLPRAGAASDAEADDLIDRALQRLRDNGLEFADGALWVKLRQLKALLSVVPTAEREKLFGAHVPPETWLVPQGPCALEALSAYDGESGRFYARRELHERLTAADRAAMLLHGAAYGLEITRVEPRRRDGKSDLARGFVRALLSEAGESGGIREVLTDAINFREPRVPDESASFARVIGKRPLKPLPCGRRACRLEEIAGAYTLKGRAGNAACEEAVGITVDDEAIGVVFNIAQEPLLTRPAREWPAMPGLTRRFGIRRGIDAIHSSDMASITLSAELDRSSIVLVSRIKEFRTPLPVLKRLMPKTRHEQRIRLMAMPEGTLLATIEDDAPGTTRGQCLYERRDW